MLVVIGLFEVFWCYVGQMEQVVVWVFVVGDVEWVEQVEVLQVVLEQWVWFVVGVWVFGEYLWLVLVEQQGYLVVEWNVLFEQVYQVNLEVWCIQCFDQLFDGVVLGDVL